MKEEIEREKRKTEKNLKKEGIEERWKSREEGKYRREVKTNQIPFSEKGKRIGH